MRPVSNEKPVNFTFYRGIHEFLNPSIFDKITVFKFYAVVAISQKILRNGNHSIKTVIFQKRTMITVIFYFTKF